MAFKLKSSQGPTGISYLETRQLIANVQSREPKGFLVQYSKIKKELDEKFELTGASKETLRLDLEKHLKPIPSWAPCDSELDWMASVIFAAQTKANKKKGKKAGETKKVGVATLWSMLPKKRTPEGRFA